LIEADVVEVRATGEMCLRDEKTRAYRVENAVDASPEGQFGVFSNPINVQIAIEGPNGYHHRRKRRSYGECRFRIVTRLHHSLIHINRSPNCCQWPLRVDAVEKDLEAWRLR
jgi:hypothetical protein